jgi:alpha-beta hydrolase superfamily lysophospholipase
VAQRGSAVFAENAPQEWLRAQVFEPLYHEIFNEPEQAQVFSLMKDWLAQSF